MDRNESFSDAFPFLEDFDRLEAGISSWSSASSFLAFDLGIRFLFGAGTLTGGSMVFTGSSDGVLSVICSVFSVALAAAFRSSLWYGFVGTVIPLSRRKLQLYNSYDDNADDGPRTCGLVRFVAIAEKVSTVKKLIYDTYNQIESIYFV